MSFAQQHVLHNNNNLWVASILMAWMMLYYSVSHAVPTSISITGLASESGKQLKKYIVPPVMKINAPYAEWAHHHLVWMNGESQNQQDLLKLVATYAQNDIPVGAVDLEAGWSTGMNNFVPNQSKFPNLYQFVKQLHSMNVKVICWTTPLINVDSPNYNTAYSKGYFVNDGRSIEWWKGRGSFIDYTNPEAVQWWHSQMNNVLILNQTDPKEGIDGWKCDGSDPYFYELIYAYGKNGHISEKAYSYMYYHDFLNYTRQVRGQDSLIVNIPVDSIFGMAYFEFAPKDIVFNGWVGNKYANYFGFRETVKNMLHSAWNKYLGFTTPIGGYEGIRSYDADLYVRWFQFAAFTSAMHNGGYGAHEPWMYNSTITKLYRKFTHAHYEIVPYLYTSGINAFQNQASLITPLTDWTMFDPSFWTFKLGKDMIVTPIFDYSNYTYVLFPEGTWVDYFDHTVTFAGVSNVTFDYSMTYEEFPAFYRAGSILPLNITSDYVNVFGNSKSHSGYLTLAIHYPIMNEEQSQMISSHGIQVKYFRNSKDNSMSITISAPNGFRADSEKFKYLLDIRGLLASQPEGFDVYQMLDFGDEQKLVPLSKFEHRAEFDGLSTTKFGCFYHEKDVSYYMHRKADGKVLRLKQQHLWIKVHDVMKGVKILIK